MGKSEGSRLRSPWLAALLLCAGPALAQTPAGAPFRVNSYTTGRQAVPRVALQPNGDFVVVWAGAIYGDSGGIALQRFDRRGTPLGPERLVNHFTPDTQDWPAVASMRGGGFVVVWQDRALTPSFDIRGRRFDASGDRLASEFIVNQYLDGDQTAPHVAGGAGGFVVTWQSYGLDGSSAGIAARRFGPDGLPLADEFVVNTYTTGGQILSDVADDGSGAFLIAWDGPVAPGADLNILAQRYSAGGARIGGEFRVNAAIADDQWGVSLSASPGGGFAAVWNVRRTGFLQDPSGRLLDANGVPQGNDFVVNTYTTGIQYVVPGAVAQDVRGDFIVAWMTGSGFLDVSGQRFDDTGGRRGAEFRVNSYTTGYQIHATVASDPSGNFVVSWASQGQDGSGLGLYAQRFGGLTPASLQADAVAGPGADGNRILEPGETAVLEPGWRNFNGAALTFGGVLSRFTGPASATYTITDSAADYGTVVDGTAGTCGAACYAVGVSNPPSRPTLHWDATVDEELTPITQHGQVGRWTVHIGDSFTDVQRTNPFYRFIETLLHEGVTAGCGATTYCPPSSTTRDQIAVFVLVAKEGAGYAPPACTTPVFNDVPVSSPFCRWIAELARRGVVSGCGGGNYCPASPVTRDQMAVFVLRTLDPALNPPACATPVFTDVPASSPFCRWIEELARRGVVTGCGGGNYCPTQPVTREQMAVFLGVTFGLSLYGP